MVALSVLLLTKNGEEDLKHLYPALLCREIYSPFEVIAVDSRFNHIDKYVDPVSLKQIPAQEFHHSRTRNFAASFAQGKVLHLSIARRDASFRIVATLIGNFEDPKVGAVSVVSFPGRDRSASAARLSTPSTALKK